MAYDLATPLLGIYPKKCHHKDVTMNVHSGFIHSSQKSGNNLNRHQLVKGETKQVHTHHGIVLHELLIRSTAW